MISLSVENNSLKELQIQKEIMILDKLKSDYNNIYTNKINIDFKALILIITASIVILVIFGFTFNIFYNNSSETFANENKLITLINYSLILILTSVLLSLISIIFSLISIKIDKYKDIVSKEYNDIFYSKIRNRDPHIFTYLVDNYIEVITNNVENNINKIKYINLSLYFVLGSIALIIIATLFTSICLYQK